MQPVEEEPTDPTGMFTSTNHRKYGDVTARSGRPPTSASWQAILPTRSNHLKAMLLLIVPPSMLAKMYRVQVACDPIKRVACKTHLFAVSWAVGHPMRPPQPPVLSLMLQ